MPQSAVQRASVATKRKRQADSIGDVVSRICESSQNSAPDADFGRRAWERGKRMRVLRREIASRLYVPGRAAVMEIVKLWLNANAPVDDYMQVIQAIAKAKAAIPLVIGSRKWPLPDVPNNTSVADLSAVAPALAVHMAPVCVGALLRMRGPVREAVLHALRRVPVEVQHVLSVRRSDLYWFVATCNYRVGCAGPTIHAALQAAISQPWMLHVGSVTLRDFTWAATASEATFVRPGGDIIVDGTPAAAVSLRDKTLLLYLLLWGRPGYANGGCPTCAPSSVQKVVADLRAALCNNKQGLVKNPHAVDERVVA